MPFTPFYKTSDRLTEGLHKIEAAYRLVDSLRHLIQPSVREVSILGPIGRMVSNLHPDNPSNLMSYRKGIGLAVDSLTGPFNQALICHSHFLLFEGIVEDKSILGIYRRTQNGLFDYQTQKIVGMPPPPSQVASLIEDLLEWAEKEVSVSPVLKAAIFYFRFLIIHPFVDGNGRVAQVLTLSLLERAGYNFKDFFVLGEYYIRDEKRYMAAFNETKDFTPWLIYFVEALTIQFEEVEQLLRPKERAQPSVLKNRVVYQF